MLDLSRIESGHLVLESAPFSLLQCVENAAHLCWGMAQKKSLDLVYSIDDHVPDALIGDATHLQQVLINLIGNAVGTQGTREHRDTWHDTTRHDWRPG